MGLIAAKIALLMPIASTQNTVDIVPMVCALSIRVKSAARPATLMMTVQGTANYVALESACLPAAAPVQQMETVFLVASTALAVSAPELSPHHHRNRRVVASAQQTLTALELDASV